MGKPKILVHLLYENKEFIRWGRLVEENMVQIGKERFNIEPDKIIYRIRKGIFGYKVIPVVYVDGKTKTTIKPSISDQKHAVDDTIVHNNARLRIIYLASTYIQEEWEKLRKERLYVLLFAGIIMLITFGVSAFIINQAIEGLHDIANAFREYLNQTTAPPIK